MASWSKDPSTKVGAVIVNPITNQVVGMGYNGFARGIDDTPERLNDRPTKLALTVHAEENAILNATSEVRGCNIYIYPSFILPSCCARCANLIVQSGIKHVISYYCPDPSERWKEQAVFAKIALDEGGVNYIGDLLENEVRKH